MPTNVLCETVWENEDVCSRVVRRGHSEPSQAEILPFPTGLPSRVTNRPAHGATLTGTFWVSVVTRCALLTVLSSVVGQTHTLAARTAPAVGHTSAATHAACRGASVFVHVYSQGSHDYLCHTHPGRMGRSDILVGSGRSAPRLPPGGTGSGLTCHTPPALSLCSHTRTLCTNMPNVNYTHD